MSTCDVGLALQVDPVAKAMINADRSLVFEPRVLLELVLRKHTSVFAASVTDLERKSLMKYQIDNSYRGTV